MNSFQQISVANRLSQYFKAMGVSIHQVTKRCGFTRGALDKMLRKDGGVHSDTLARILANYPDLDADWVLLGIGEMKRSAPRQGVERQDGEGKQETSRSTTRSTLSLKELQAIRQLLEERNEIDRQTGNVAKKKAG